MRSFRDQRLANDHEELLRLQQELDWGSRARLEVQAVGTRPYQSYNLIFHCGGYVDELGAVRKRHHLFLEFPMAYPMEAPPTFKRVSPLLHPNIYPHGVFCLGFEGDRKWRPGISLESLILHVSRLIRFDPDWVNLDPPANRTQAFWEEFIKKVRLPADDEPFVMGDQPSGPPVSQPAVTQKPPTQPANRRGIRIEPSPVRRSGPAAQIRPSGSRRSSGPIRIKRRNPND